MWVRGLKLTEGAEACDVAIVAPHVGAWIETIRVCTCARAFTSRTPCGCVN